MNTQLENATAADYPEIVEVWEASVRATHHFLEEEHIQFFKPLILRDYLKMVDLRIVRNDEKRIVAFLGVADSNLEMLFLHPSSIRKGLGSKLARYAIDELKVTKVDVNEQNPDAVKFYQHMGFTITSRSEKDGLGKPFPILHMELAKTN